LAYDILELTGLLEENIRSSIKSSWPYEWDENFITQRLLQDLRTNLSNIELHSKEYRRYIHWETYKLKGKYETNFGDISLIVKIHYKDGTHLEGVAFLEAKRRDWRKTSFSAMNLSQLNRILKNAPRAQYLLYDYQDITDFQNPTEFINSVHGYYGRHHMPFSLTATTRAVSVPLNIAKATGYKDTLLYRYGNPLSLMLTSRYFQGLDLEFDETSLLIATGFLEKFGLPKYVLKIEISEEGAESKIDDRPNYINHDKYIEIN
jgi:hypothetical protein